MRREAVLRGDISAISHQHGGGRSSSSNLDPYQCRELLSRLAIAKLRWSCRKSLFPGFRRGSTSHYGLSREHEKRSYFPKVVWFSPLCRCGLSFPGRKPCHLLQQPYPALKSSNCSRIWVLKLLTKWRHRCFACNDSPCIFSLPTHDHRQCWHDLYRTLFP